MATPIFVKTPVTTTQFATIETNLASNEVILAGAKIDITPAQIKSRLTVSVVKSSEIDDVNTNLVNNNTKAVPGTFDIAAYQADILYLNKLKQVQAALFQQYNEMTTLVEVAQHNLMDKTNNILTNARIVAKTDQGVSDAMAALDIKYFTHAAPGVGLLHDIIEGGVQVVSGINPRKPFTNTGKSMLAILNIGGSAADTKRVNGFTTIVLPVDWVNIIITNLSTTDAGEFEVFMK